MFEQGLPQDDFESPPLEALQMMCRELGPGNATILLQRADLQVVLVVQSESRVPFLIAF